MEAKTVELMREKIRALGPSKGFVFVDLGLTKKEFDLLDSLKFDNVLPGTTSQYDRFGSLSLLTEELPSFLISIGNNKKEVIRTVTEIISRTVSHVVEATNQESAWVCMRASTPTPDFDLPRWHIDGEYYHSSHPSMPVLKFAATLKGKSTLLYPLTDEQRELFNSHQNDRIILAQLLDLKHAQSPKRGEGVFFIVADQKMGGVHSEPRVDENRLFFSVLVGDKSQIHELDSRWNPRGAI